MAKEKKMMKHAGYIHEDMSKPSNLPQEVKMMEFPKLDAVNLDYNNSLSYLDGQMNGMVTKVRKNRAKSAY
jgi:hypothetical protein